jgi:predicted naringenin-chalcone synthase
MSPSTVIKGRVFESSGIRRRYAVRPLEWYLEPLGWPERSTAYLEGACQLFVDAATKALCDAGITAAEVGTVVTISSTGIATPSLEARVASRIGFRSRPVWRNPAPAALCCWLRSNSAHWLSGSTN